MRKLPSRKVNGLAHDGPAVAPGPLVSPAPPRLDDLICAANSPDFWVEPHGLCVAVYGPPRHSQRFGAKHAFWPWPREGDTGGDFSRSPGGNSRIYFSSARERRTSSSPSSSSPPSPAFSVKGGGFGGGRGVRGAEVVVPGVVCDSDYRLCLSTGVKFSDTHLATVLDSSRVLVDEMDEMMVVAGPSGGEGGVTTVLLSS